MGGLVKDDLCITLDVDWARDEIIYPVVEAMERAGVKATFFATHESRLLEGLDPARFEIGLHPNFNNSGGDFEGPVRKLKSLYPRAEGARSHSLFVSSGVLQSYVGSGIKYESNAHLPLHEGLRPVIRFGGLVSIPMYWADDTNFRLKGSFNLGDLKLETPGLKVLDFHPIHIFMNTSSEAHYEEYKSHYQEPQRLGDFINRKELGVGTLFQSLLDYLKTSGRRTYTLGEVCERYLAGAD
jgi:hypothetical protein